jgi:hypothetical protein
VAVTSEGPEIVGGGWHRLVLPGPLGARREQTGVIMIDQRTATQRIRTAPPWPTTWAVEQRLPTRSELRAEIRANRPLRRLANRLLGRRMPRSAGATGDGPAGLVGTPHGDPLPWVVTGLPERSGVAK